MNILFPKLATIAYANRIIRDCINAQKSREPITFSFENTTFIDPFAITLVAGIIHCCLRETEKEIFYEPPKDRKIKAYLSQIGFNSFFQLESEDIHRDTSIELRQLTALNPIYIEDLVELMDSRMSLSSGVKDSLKLSLQELLTNVFDHSRSDAGCFVSAQYYPREKTIRLCITDFGVGILANLKKKYDVTTDIEAIRLAVEEGITSRRESAGRGLNLIRRFLRVNEGTLTIISGNGKVNFYSNKIEDYNMTKGFDGTIVNLKINANKESFYFLREEYLF